MRKIIYIVKNDPNWRQHPILHRLTIMEALPIPPPNTPHTQWIHEIATIGKKTQKDARTIIAKHSRKSAQKAIAKFQQLISLKSKQGNKIIFYHTENPPLDSILDTNNNLLTNPIDIADEIYIQQSKINASTIKTCEHQPQNHPDYTCQVRQYPWHELNGFILRTRGNNNASISALFTRETYDTCVKHLSKHKTPGPDQIPNSIL
jgi:hypothetical protein